VIELRSRARSKASYTGARGNDVQQLRTVLIVGALAIAAAACGDDEPNFFRDDDCWPVDRATDGGTVRLGLGPSEFEPMPSTTPFIRGNQGGSYFPLHARTRALDPGDPEDYMAEGNPMTRFRAFLADGSEVGPECGATLGYVEAGPVDGEEGWSDLVRSVNLEFLPQAVADAAFDTEIVLSVDVIDRRGRHAHDEVAVFVTAPPPLGE
jgi:hypothetical protein